MPSLQLVEKSVTFISLYLDKNRDKVESDVNAAADDNNDNENSNACVDVDDYDIADGGQYDTTVNHDNDNCDTDD